MTDVTLVSYRRPTITNVSIILLLDLNPGGSPLTLGQGWRFSQDRDDDTFLIKTRLCSFTEETSIGISNGSGRGVGSTSPDNYTGPQVPL